MLNFRKKKVLLLIWGLLFHLSSPAQEIVWQKTIGGSNDDLLRSIAPTSDGGFICGGNSNSDISGDKTENGQGYTDYWVVKLDGLGNIQWQNTLGGSGGEELTTVRQTMDGGYILGGGSTSDISPDKTENSMGGWDYWIVKLDSSGNILWDNTIKGNGTDIFTALALTADGGFICAGYSNSDISGDKTENSQGYYDYWIVKLDSTGNIEWQNTIGGDTTEHMYSISQTSDGGYICGGESSSDISGDKTEITLGLFDYWVIKLDSAGNIEWQNTIGGNHYDELLSISQTSDGGFICGGNSRSDISGDKTEICLGFYDYWIVKLDANGNIEWQNAIGGDSFDEIAGIAQTMDGNYFCAGRTDSQISADITEINQGSTDFWIIRLDSTGNIITQNMIGGSSTDYLYTLALISNDSYACGGFSYSNTSGDKSEDSKGSADFWLLKLTHNYNVIHGELFADLNTNNIHDTGEPPLSGKILTESNTGLTDISNQDGEYSIIIPDTGNFAISSPVLQHYTSIPSVHNAYFSFYQETDSLNDFTFQPAGTVNDLEIYVTPVSLFRPGFNAYYNLHYRNAGTTAQSGTVAFYPGSQISYITSSVTATFVSADSIVWATPLLNPFDEGDILVTVNVDSSTSIGTQVNSCASIEPITGDASPSNNLSCMEVLVTGSYDPNDILVNRSYIATTELNSPPFLEYIIRFQNTGNDTAFNVRVQNNLTGMLNSGSFELIAASHPVIIDYQNHSRLLTFRFDNILLADSNVNEPMSHGFVHYRIKPQTSLSAGDSILNKAFIYFDFNSPVVTNTAITEIILPTFVSSINHTFDFLIYPNPASNDVTVAVSLKETSEVEFQLCNALGQVVLSDKESFSSGKNEIHFATHEYPEGVYFLKVSVGGNGNVAVKKLVIGH